MSDKWDYYPCTMGEHPASIFLDLGIKDQIENAPTNLVRLQLHYKNVHENGLPRSDEFEPVKTAEDQLQAFAEGENSWYVGRITVEGCRYFYIYSECDAPRWEAFTEELSRQSGYLIEVDFREDPKHEAYWNELFPTEDDWQVIKDLGVIEQLKKHGDDGSAARKVDHWCYFPSQSASSPFITWAIEQGYQYDQGLSGPSKGGRHCVRLSHTGTIILADITHHTISLRRKASEHGGDYDGWETQVLSENTATAQQ